MFQQSQRSTQDVVQEDLANAVLLPEQLLYIYDSTYNWNIPLWRALLPGRTTTITDWPTHLMNCCFKALSFPTNSLDFQRKLGVLRSVVATTTTTDSNEVTLLWGWIHQGCLEVASNGAFTWNMPRVYELYPHDDILSTHLLTHSPRTCH